MAFQGSAAHPGTVSTNRQSTVWSQVHSSSAQDDMSSEISEPTAPAYRDLSGQIWNFNPERVGHTGPRGLWAEFLQGE